MTMRNVVLGDGIQVGVLALFSGHHSVWASGTTQIDICNNADDLVVLNCTTGRKHRFPITAEFLPWLRRLIESMNAWDLATKSPWAEHNTTVRSILFSAAADVVRQDPPQLNILNPALIAPALSAHCADVDDMLLARIASHPESLIS